MNNRERFYRTMKYQSCDHPPFYADGPWNTTLIEWEKQGLPKGVDLNEYFGLEPMRMVYAGLDTGPWPHFEQRVIEENDEVVIKIDAYGRTVRDYKRHTTMPEWLEFPVKNAADLRRVIDERYNPDLEGKIPLIREGGYIPRIDHSVSSDISLENYQYYISVLKEIYGMD